MKQLSQSLEDYIEAIYILSKTNKVARVKELSEYFNVTTPSVVGAIKTLAKNGLVNHEKYGYIELTEAGEEKARAIYEKHHIISSFFSKFLGVSKEIADKDACELEHSITPETYKRIIKFFEFMETCPEIEPAFIRNFHTFIEEGKRPVCELGHRNKKIPDSRVKLSQLKIGEKGRVLNVKADDKLRRKMLVLGIIRGETIEVIRAAPLGSPIDYKIKDYHLSLRKEEADTIFVEPCKE